MDLLRNSKCKNVWNQVMKKWTAVTEHVSAEDGEDREDGDSEQ